MSLLTLTIRAMQQFDWETKMLTGQEIKSAAIVTRDLPGNYRNSSYDVRVAHVIDQKGRIKDTFAIPPRGIIHVVSEEILHLPLEISGIAIVKTGLCNDGILALNIGILDPGYVGRVSTVLLNFSSEEVELKAGDIFLRLCFFRLSEKTLAKPNPLSDEHYIESIKRRSRDFAPDFLGIDALAKKMAKEQRKKVRATLIRWGVAVTLLFGAIAVLVPIAINYSSFYMMKDVLHPPDVALVPQTVDIAKMQASIDDLKAELDRTAIKTQELEENLHAASSKKPKAAP